MRPPKPKDLIHPEISLLPLIDVYLVLLIVLLVIGPMIRAGSAKPEPPAARAGAAAAGGASRGAGVLALDEPQLAVSIESDGSLYVDGKLVKQADLQTVLGEIWALTPNRPVMVKGDRRVRYEHVRWVLQSVNAAGFRRAGLTVGPRER